MESKNKIDPCVAKYTSFGRRIPSKLEIALANFLCLRYYEDLRTLLFGFIYFSLIGFQLCFDYRDNACKSAFLFFLTSLVSFQGAVSVHNAVHTPLFMQQWKNNLFQCILSVWFGHCASSYVPGHNISHHRNLQTPKDSMRTTKMKFKWNFLNGLFFMPATLLGTSENDAKYFSVQKSLNRPIFHQLRLEAMVYVSINVLAAAHNPRKWFWVMWLPCLVGKYMIISLNMLQHDGCDTNSKYNHSRNFCGSTLNFFLFNNGYHGIHHIYPGRHWSLLKHDHDERIKPHVHPNLDQSSILLYTFKQFIYPGKRVDYLGKPVPIVDDGPDQPWFYAITESYSDQNIGSQASSNCKSKMGHDNKLIPKLASRSAKSYTFMKED